MKILIVDDAPEIVEIIGICLSIAWPDAAMLGAATGREAVAVVEAESPDLVVLDLGLSDMEGLKVLKEVRRRSSAPIIVVSAMKEKRVLQQARDAGANAYLPKPFSFKDLMEQAGAVWQRAAGTPA